MMSPLHRMRRQIVLVRPAQLADGDAPLATRIAAACPLQARPDGGRVVHAVIAHDSRGPISWEVACQASPAVAGDRRLVGEAVDVVDAARAAADAAGA